MSLLHRCFSLTKASRFGGLIAYGVQFIHSDLANFRILFLIEGLPTLLLSLVVFLFLPSYPTKSRCEAYTVVVAM